MRWMLIAICCCFAFAGADPPVAEPLDSPPDMELAPAGGGHWSPPPVAPIPDGTYRRIWDRIRRHRALLRGRGLAESREGVSQPLFEWPLRAAAHLTDNGYHAIDAFVDHDPAFPGALTDYECGTRTYDTPGGYNHRGSDFFSWPFAWLKVDQSAVEVVAAANGVIIDRGDGNFDRRCDCATDDPNYVILEHADGSTVWYFHMKNGSVTPRRWARPSWRASTWEWWRAPAVLADRTFTSRFTIPWMSSSTPTTEPATL